ncbi:nicotinamide riboside transporter PnuC [Roseateles sp. BYS180W]|uniref:nicotinamide riboside transporter PnuC n=1 Tax=Roseateles rivi TaxID=3299028 RepID=UPI0037494F87
MDFSFALAPAFQALGSPVSWLELLAFVLSLWMVRCNMRVQPLGWPLAALSSLLYGYLFWHGKLYAEAVLQLMFIALALWGWSQWLRGVSADGSPLPITRLSPRQRLAALVLVLGCWPLLGYFLDQATDSPLPYWDALPTVGSVLGQWLLARKRQDNWAVWVLVNVVSVILFALKGFWLTVVLYALFVPLSVWGWLLWERLRQAQPKGPELEPRP